MLSSIKQDRITDLVHATLRQHILERRFAPGERLHVEELAEQLGVSRTPVREALNLLAAEALVVIVPRSGTFVASLTPEEVADVLDIRVCLEGLAAERVAQLGLSAAAIRELRRILTGASKGKTREQRSLAHAEANRAFHHRIVELSGNRKLAQIYSSLNAHTMMALIQHASPDWPERWDTELEDHERVLSAIERGDAPAARQAMEDHVRRGKHSLLADMRSAARSEPQPAG